MCDSYSYSFSVECQESGPDIFDLEKWSEAMTSLVVVYLTFIFDDLEKWSKAMTSLVVVYLTFIFDSKEFRARQKKENVSIQPIYRVRKKTEKCLARQKKKNILSEARNNEDGEGKKKLNAEKQMGSDSPLSSCHKSGLMKYSLPPFFLCLPGVGGSGPEDGQNNQQAVSGIYKHTLGTVSHCPNATEYKQRAFEKCAEVCGIHMQDEGCSYHCMRDSYKTSLVEFCGKPKILFDFCPEYDSIGQTIQKDFYTPCNPSNSQRHFWSSDASFCDPDNCLRLREAAVSTVESTIETTTSSGGINDGWLSQNWYILVAIGFVVVVLLVVVGCIFCLAAFSRKLKKKNPHDKQAEVKSMLFGNAV